MADIDTLRPQMSMADFILTFPPQMFSSHGRIKWLMSKAYPARFKLYSAAWKAGFDVNGWCAGDEPQEPDFEGYKKRHDEIEAHYANRAHP